ncbi:hypothetical protein PMAYCL1PPCAC_11563, partial [Pristionchus mayeri]
ERLSGGEMVVDCDGGMRTRSNQLEGEIPRPQGNSAGDQRACCNEYCTGPLPAVCTDGGLGRRGTTERGSPPVDSFSPPLRRSAHYARCVLLSTCIRPLAPHATRHRDGRGDAATVLLVHRHRSARIRPEGSRRLGVL